MAVPIQNVRPFLCLQLTRLCWNSLNEWLNDKAKLSSKPNLHDTDTNESPAGACTLVVQVIQCYLNTFERQLNSCLFPPASWIGRFLTTKHTLFLDTSSCVTVVWPHRPRQQHTASLLLVPTDVRM